MIMTVYRLSYEEEKYPRINIDPYEGKDKLPKGKSCLAPNTSKKNYWAELNGTYYYEDDMPKDIECPDISVWYSSIVLSAKAVDIIGDELRRFGEILPISIEGDRRYYFNLLNATDAIDPFNTKKAEVDGIDLGIQKLAFLEHEIKDLCIFDTEYDGYSYLYCTDEFKSLIEESGLTSGWSYHENLRV